MVRYLMRSADLEEGEDAFKDDSDRDSDHIDSDIEEMLYTSIHHQTVNSNELSCPRSELDMLSRVDSELWPTCKIRNERKGIKIDQLMAKKQNSQKQVFSSTPDLPTRKSGRELLTNGINLDISYGNDIILDGVDPVEQMNKFYMEDDYDSEDERKKLKKMTNDRRYWKICSKDLALVYRHSKYSKVKQCKLCHQIGHVERDCPEKPKVCRICGENDHEYSSCPAKNFCSTCFTHGHLAKKCKAKSHCSLCKMVGHTDTQCTFHWRKFLTVTTPEDYHQMTQVSQIPGPITANKTVSCCNCGMKGSHFSHECNFLTINYRRHEIPSPFLNVNMDRNKRSNKKAIKKRSSSDYQQLEIQVGSSNENESSPLDIDSDDSLDYVLNLLKQSTGETSSLVSNGKAVKRKQSKFDINLNINSNTKKRKVKNQVKSNHPKVKAKKMAQLNGEFKFTQKKKIGKKNQKANNKPTQKQKQTKKPNVNHPQQQKPKKKKRRQVKKIN